MRIDELRRRIGVILSAEDSEPPDWDQVDRLSDELLRQLIADRDSECPEIVRHYIDDADIRCRDEAYGAQQRERIRRFVETGEYKDSTPVPLWTCLVALAVVIVLIGWLLW